MIFYAYSASMIFNKVKTANSWFTILNTMITLIMMPLMVPESLIEGSFLEYLKPFKYFSPFFDITYNLVQQQKFMEDLSMIA